MKDKQKRKRMVAVKVVLRPVESAGMSTESRQSDTEQPRYRVEKWSAQHPPNPAMIRDILARDGYTVNQWADSPGTIYGMHRHATAQSHWVVSGSLEICVVGREAVLLGEGDRDFIPADTLHSARVAGDTTVIYLVGEKIG